ncbi:hypothetical protein B5X24_HaOG207388 [Helicoverpa armigera]|uniref:Uncharacterized protein n=1 Tax=Helicoverpa armigera TaxID=29058 RepID=A0A2W1BHV8_HELAM|nr:hypothetical protein B5X24_HaOG207388 [Helicoverpa armigera]
MFVYLLLLLPNIETANVIIKEYSITEVKVAGNALVQVLTKPIDDEQSHLRKKDQEGMLKLLGTGFMVPTFENDKQTRFRKIRHGHRPVKFKLGMRDGGGNQTQPWILLIRLFTKLLEYAPMFFNLGVN